MDSARHHYEKGLQMSTRTSDGKTVFKGFIHLGLAKVNLAQNKMEQAKDHLDIRPTFFICLNSDILPCIFLKTPMMPIYCTAMNMFENETCALVRTTTVPDGMWALH